MSDWTHLPNAVHIDRVLHLPCGGEAHFDEGSGISHRCWHCMATVGSIGQSQHCKDQIKFWDTWEKWSGKGWDYATGRPK